VLRWRRDTRRTSTGRTIFSLAVFRYYKVLPLLILALIGVIAVLFATSSGIGISPDSTVYIGAARNLLQGRGLSESTASGTKPLTHFPPLLPSLLAVGGLLGVEPLAGARWLNAILFGATILLGGLLIRLYTRGALWAALLGSFLLLTSHDMLLIHSMAWTEPLFLYFGFLGLALLAAHFDGRNTLVASSVAVAFAFLARYSGVAFVMTGIAGILLLERNTFRKRIGDAVIFGVISCGPMALWMAGNVFATGAPTSRHLAVHPVTYTHLQQALVTVSQWGIPGRGRSLLVFIALVAIAVSACSHHWEGSHRRRRAIPPGPT
jgi:hypothetical protein